MYFVSFRCKRRSFAVKPVLLLGKTCSLEQSLSQELRRIQAVLTFEQRLKTVLFHRSLIYSHLHIVVSVFIGAKISPLYSFYFIFI